MVEICIGDKVKLLPDFFVYRKFRESYHPVESIVFGPEKIYQIHLVNYETGERSHAVQCYEDQIIDVKRNDESEMKNDEIKVGDFIVPPEHFRSFAESKAGKLKVVYVGQDYVFVDMPITGVSISSIPGQKCLAVANCNLKKVQDTDMTINVGDFVEVPPYWENYPESKAGKLEVVRIKGDSVFLHMPISGIKVSETEKLCFATYSKNLKKIQNTETKTPEMSDPTSISVGSLVALNDEGIKEVDDGRWYLQSSLIETAKKSHYKITHIFRGKDHRNGQDKILEYKVKSEHEDLKERTFYLEPNLVRVVKKEEKEEGVVNTKKKFNVGDSVYVPLRHALNLPSTYYHWKVLNSVEYYNFAILDRKGNRTCTDYFVAIDFHDGGKYENGLCGYWLKEEFLLSHAEMENEKRGKNASTSKEEKNMSKETSVDLSVYKEQMKELRTFDVILAPGVEFGKTCIRYAVHLALSAIGKSNKFIEAAFTMLDEFIDHNAQLADNAIRWILGFMAKNVHLIRKIPVVGEWKVLEFLERPEIQRFGVYAQASSEGKVLGDLITKILGLVQEWIFGSAITTRITDAIQSEEGLLRFVSGLDANMKKGLAEKLRVENESEHEAQAEAEMAGQKVAAAT